MLVVPAVKKKKKKIKMCSRSQSFPWRIIVFAKLLKQFVCVHACACVCMHTHVLCVCARMRVCVRACMCAYVCVCLHACVLQRVGVLWGGSEGVRWVGGWGRARGGVCLFNKQLSSTRPWVELSTNTLPVTSTVTAVRAALARCGDCLFNKKTLLTRPWIKMELDNTFLSSALCQSSPITSTRIFNRRRSLKI